jgi:peptide/nickel transport system permease protein
VFLIRRLILALVVLFVFASATFFFLAAKTNPLAGHPLLPAYGRWLRGLVTGSSYHSLGYVAPTGLHFTPPSLWPQLLPALGHTAVLLAIALLVVVCISLAVGCLAAARRGSALDAGLRIASYWAWAVPAFLVALVVQQLVTSVGGSKGIGPFPVAGWPGHCPAGVGINAGTISPCPAAGSGATYVANVFRYVTLPALALAVGFIGLHSRYLRAQLVATLRDTYITTARSKGLSERAVVVRHALRASLATFVSVLLADFGAVFGAALAVDWVFKLNGIGTLLILQFPSADHPAPIDTYLLEILLIITAGFLLCSTLVSELAARWLDPRMRERG